MPDVIVTQLAEEFKKMLEEIMLKEKKYLEENKDARANRYYQRRPKTVVGELELDIPRTRDNGFKPSILPERKRVTFLLDDVIRAMFIAGLSARKTGEVLKNLLGSSISSLFISSSVDIADEIIERFRNRKLGYYPVLYI